MSPSSTRWMVLPLSVVLMTTDALMGQSSLPEPPPGSPPILPAPAPPQATFPRSVSPKKTSLPPSVIKSTQPIPLPGISAPDIPSPKKAVPNWGKSPQTQFRLPKKQPAPPKAVSGPLESEEKKILLPLSEYPYAKDVGPMPNPKAPTAPPIQIQFPAKKGKSVPEPPPPPQLPEPQKPLGFRLLGPYKKLEKKEESANPPTPKINKKQSNYSPSSPEVPPAHLPVSLKTAFPRMKMRKIGPSEVRVGQTGEYMIVVQNHGETPLEGLHIEDQIPPTTELVKTIPQGSVNGNRLTWIIPILPAGQEVRLRTYLNHRKAGKIHSHVVSSLVLGQADMEAMILNPALEIKITGPKTGKVGEKVKFKLHLQNSHRKPLTNLVLNVGPFPPELFHPYDRGKGIEADLEPLQPGKKREIDIEMEIKSSGLLSFPVKISQDQEVLARDRAEISVSSAPLMVLKKSGPEFLKQGHTNEYMIELVNKGASAANNVIIEDQLPDNFEFVAASKQGIFVPGSRTVQWKIDRLPPGQNEYVVVRLRSREAGQFENRVFAEAEGGFQVRLQAHLVVVNP